MKYGKILRIKRDNLRQRDMNAAVTTEREDCNMLAVQARER
jgi:hypothetical protein